MSPSPIYDRRNVPAAFLSDCTCTLPVCGLPAQPKNYKPCTDGIHVKLEMNARGTFWLSYIDDGDTPVYLPVNFEMPTVHALNVCALVLYFDLWFQYQPSSYKRWQYSFFLNLKIFKIIFNTNERQYSFYSHVV